MTTYAKVGICQTVRIPLNCDGTINTSVDPLWSCGNTTVEENPLLTDGLSLSDPSGMPNRDCIEIEIDPDYDGFELVETTCSLFDTDLDALYGYSEKMTSAPGKRAKKKNGSSCICQCGEDTCEAGFALAYWSLAYCGGKNTRHPDGKFVLTVYPLIKPRPTTNTRTTDANLNGRQYLSRIYENPAFAQGIQIGADWLIPADETPFDRCSYEYLTDICPERACDCGTCETSAPTLAVPATTPVVPVLAP